MSEIPTKVCTGCGQEKPARHPEFDRNSGRPDGLAMRCVECRRANRRDCYARNAESMRRERRQYRRDHPDRRLKANRTWRERNPEQKRAADTAARLLFVARKRGVITRPARCEACGGGGAIYACPADMARPVETVRWLCSICRRAWTPEQRAAHAATIGRN